MVQTVDICGSCADRTQPGCFLDFIIFIFVWNDRKMYYITLSDNEVIKLIHLKFRALW